MKAASFLLALVFVAQATCAPCAGEEPAVGNGGIFDRSRLAEGMRVRVSYRFNGTVSTAIGPIRSAGDDAMVVLDAGPKRVRYRDIVTLEIFQWPQTSGRAALNKGERARIVAPSLADEPIIGQVTAVDADTLALLVSTKGSRLPGRTAAASSISQFEGPPQRRELD